MTNKQPFMGNAEIYLDSPPNPLSTNKGPAIPNYVQQSDGTMLYRHPQTGKMVPPDLLPEFLPRPERKENV